ncbi:MAG: DUF3307 domain-containing protein [Candidatus Eisenbacteria bacterium]
MLTELVQYWGAAGAALLSLLLAGHFLSDFGLQTERLAEAKRGSNVAMLLHVGQVLLTHALLVVPVWGWAIVPAVLALAFSHALADLARRVGEQRGRSPVLLLLADQLVHVAAIVIIWVWLCQSSFLTEHAPLVPLGWVPAIRRYPLLAAGYALCLRGGSTFVTYLLSECQQTGIPGAHTSEHAGKVLGYLERTLFYALVLLGQWTVVGFIVAAKSIGPLDQKGALRPDYYRMIGTLASLLVATASALLVRAIT